MILTIILVLMVAIWFFLYERMRSVASIWMDVVNFPWSFLNFYDRYSFLLKFVGTITIGAIAASIWSRNFTAAYIMVFAILDNVILQALMLLFYERFVHATYGKLTQGEPKSPYTPAKYALVLTLGFGQVMLFGVGMFLCVASFQ